ncbi:MAG: hypothetical protein Q9220_007072 [cf. Caloplaca sp. 1 TL-2023]
MTTAKRTQNWLFFGLLHVFLARLFKKEDFVTLSHSSNAWVINTRLLPLRCSEIVKSIKEDESLSRSGTALREALKQRWNDAYLEARLHLEFLDMHMDIDTDETLRLVAAPVSILLESLQRLAAQTFWSDEKNPSMCDASPMPAKFSIWRMLDQHWCFAQVKTMLRFHVPFVNHYLSGLPRQHFQIHDGFCSWEQCLANNVDEMSYQTKHLQSDCQCEFLGPDPSDLANIIRDNRMPLVELEIMNHRPKLRLVSAKLGTKYVSISPVWIGGLGNFQENKLPSCQLLNLYRLLHNLSFFRPQQPRMTYFQISWPRWIDSSLLYIQWLLNKVSQVRSFFNQIQLKHTEPMRFWMDTLCVPVQPENAVLRQNAINNMALTYAAAERCLVLDQELQSITMKHLTPTQLNAHVLCSTWLTRSWTFQEARLSRAWYAQFKDGLFNPNNKLNAAIDQRLYNDWNLFKSDEQMLAGQLINWYYSMPAVRKPDMDSNQNNRIIESEISNMMNVWNQLVSRSTSKMEDVHGILANTLDLSAAEVLALPAQQRMKAILRAQKKIPAKLVFTLADKIQDENCRWVPLHPQNSYVDESYGVLEPSHDGFFLDKDEGGSVGFLVDPSVPRHEKLQLIDPFTLKTCWIQIMRESNGPATDHQAPGDTIAVCYLMGNWQQSWRGQSVSRRFAGARFALRKREGMTWHLVFEYVFLYSHHRRWGRKETDEAYAVVKAVKRSSADTRFHIDSSKL